jgi:hypothetical protein
MLKEYRAAQQAGWNYDYLDQFERIKKIYQIDYEICFHNFENCQDLDNVLVNNFFSDTRPGRFLNIGSANGRDQTYALLIKGWSGVYCDPDPRALVGLLDQTAQYKDQVVLINSAITEHGGLCQFYLNELVGLSTTCEHLLVDQFRYHVTNSLTLDQLLDFVGEDFDYVQFDIEGIDDAVVKNINWATRLPNCKMIGIEGGLSPWEQLWDQGQYVISDVTEHNVYYKRLSAMGLDQHG